jgi:RND family efflux transporter MFP subunit
VTDLTHELASLRLVEAGAPRARRRAWLIVAAVSMAAVAAILYSSSGLIAATEVNAVTPLVERSGVTPAGSRLLTASGYVVARRKAIVSAKIQGRLAELHVEEGARVHGGDVIARLESEDYEAQVSRARARVLEADAQIASARAAVRRAEADRAEAQRQLGVSERLAARRLIAADTFEANRSRVRVLDAAVGEAAANVVRAEAARAQALADRRFAEAQLANTVIRAPFSGVIVRKMAEVGESVAPIPPGVNLSTSSGAVVALADLDTLEVEVDVAEANVAKLFPGQRAEVTVEAFAGKQYTAELRQITPTADRTKATVSVKVTILERDPNLKPEMSAKATFLEANSRSGETRTGSRIFVPALAVTTREGSDSVFEIVDGRAKVQRVSIGARREDRLEVTGGLDGTEMLIADPPPELRDGARVAVKR